MRTTRSGRSLSLGTSNRPADSTLDRWTDVEVFITSDHKAIFRCRRFTNDGKFVDEYEFVMDDETAIMDLAAQALHAVIGIQTSEDNKDTIRRMTMEPTALDGPEEIERKKVIRDTAHHRRVVTGNVKKKSGSQGSTGAREGRAS